MLNYSFFYVTLFNHSTANVLGGSSDFNGDANTLTATAHDTSHLIVSISASVRGFEERRSRALGNS